MSAFCVGFDHIDALLTFAIRRGPYGTGGASFCHELGGRRTIDRDNATAIGQVLLKENERSIDARYHDNDDPKTAGNYTFAEWTAPLTPVMILKGCSCFDYQACETDDYEQSLAHAIIDGIRQHAISLLPGYEAAAGWEFRRPQVKRAAIGQP